MKELYVWWDDTCKEWTTLLQCEGIHQCYHLRVRSKYPETCSGHYERIIDLDGRGVRVVSDLVEELKSRQYDKDDVFRALDELCKGFYHYTGVTGVDVKDNVLVVCVSDTSPLRPDDFPNSFRGYKVRMEKG